MCGSLPLFCLGLVGFCFIEDGVVLFFSGLLRACYVLMERDTDESIK